MFGNKNLLLCFVTTPPPFILNAGMIVEAYYWPSHVKRRRVNAMTEITGINLKGLGVYFVKGGE